MYFDFCLWVGCFVGFVGGVGGGWFVGSYNVEGENYLFIVMVKWLMVVVLGYWFKW